MQGDMNVWNNETISQFGGTNLMIKTGQLKYQYYGSDMPEVLFDLERDPTESVNYMQDPRYSDEIGKFRFRAGEPGFPVPVIGE